MLTIQGRQRAKLCEANKILARSVRLKSLTYFSQRKPSPMSLHSWLRSLRARRVHTTARRAVQVPQANQLAELLEPRCLLAVTPLIVNNTDLLVQLESSDNVTIQADSSGNLQVLSNGSLVIATPTVAVNTLTSISVFGGDGPNRIDLTNVTTSAFAANLTVTVNGGDGGDTILGSEFADSLMGGNGADSITGALADDTLEGSNGNDTLAGGTGNDSLFGGDGADSIHGDVGNDTVVAGNGADQVFGDAGFDSLNGGDGSDTLSGEADDDTLSGDNGNDSLLGGTENDSILGGSGNDTALGGDGLDTINGGADNDSMTGDAGNDNLDGGDGNDTLLGNADDDTLNGGLGNDCVSGGDGNDSVLGGAGQDFLNGDDFDLSLVGMGNDTVLGQAGNDTLNGGGGGDSIDGGTGNDLVRSGDVDTQNGVLISINDLPTVVEGTGGISVATFLVTLSRAFSSTVTVQYTTVNGTALGNNVDYATTAGTLTFAPNVTQLPIPVSINPDGFAESSESFSMQLVTATNGVIVKRFGTATIIDDDVIAQGPAPLNAGATQFNGCIQTIVAHPSNPNILYAGAVNGGIWRTDNGTAANPTWVPQTDFNSSLAIGSIAFDLTDPTGNTLIAGTGSTSSYGGAGSLPIGLLVTTNGGSTWTEISPPILQNEVIISATKSGNLILAGSDNIYVGAFFPFLRGSGMFRSTDGGMTFTLISGAAGSGLPAGPINDIVQDPSVANRYYATIRNVGVFRSDDGGATWANVTNNITGINAGTPKLELAIHNSPGNNVIYAGVLGAGNGLAGLFRSTNAGASWTALDRPAAPFGQGNLHFSIAANPTNPNLVYVDGNVGGVFRVDASLAAGSQVTSLGSSGHPDSREMTFDLSGNLWNSGDGGLYRLPNATTATTGWTGVADNMQVGEVHNLAYDNVSRVLIRGAQDNGTAIQNTPNSLTWTLIFGGDGAGVEVDDVTLAANGQSLRYYSAQNLGGFSRATYDSNNNLVNVVNPALTVTGNGAPIVGQFTTPLAINSVAQQRLLIGGGNSLYESLNQGNTITEIGRGIAVNGFGGEPLVAGGRRNGVPNPDVIYAGSGNRVFVRTVAGGPVSATATAFPGGTVSDIVLDPNDWMTAYVADSNRVYRTTDAGATWTDLTGNLMVDFIHTIDFIPGASPAIVIGARLGVFVSLTAAPGVWNELGAAALPNAPVWELDYNAQNDTLYVAEFGRGIFSFPNVSLAVAGAGGSGGSGGGPIVLPTAIGDTINGGDGNDTLFGADGNDTLNGMAGNDSLVGGAGNDSLLGGAGNDNLDGGIGDDVLDGQSENDLVKGGDGSDTYIWNGAGDGVDTLSSLSGYDRVRVQGTDAANNYVVSQVSGQVQITDGSAVLNLSPIIQVVDIFAGAGNDRITINALDRVRTAMVLTVNGEDGNDKINSNGANLGFVRVSLIGGLGDDTLIGGSGIDSLDGGDGDDSLNAQGGNDLVFGGLGDDTIIAGTGNDRVFGGDGNDSIDAGAGDDSVVGEVGADTITGSDGNDTIDGGDGSDVINGGSGNDSILGGNESDDLNGSTGNDTVRGGASDDTIIGENGNDSLFGDDGNDSILGYDGDDTISGGDGDDTLDGMNGNDLVGGGNGDDIMNGAAGNDTLTGGDGNDTIAGGAGNDILLGDEGDDSLNGNGSTDIINPGEGTNTVLDPITEIDTTFVLSASLLAALA
jgi:Ca2+-binding RTX toxin-like protein